MGGRLSKPLGPDGVSESSSAPTPAKPTIAPKQTFKGNRINARTIVAPAAAFTMAILLFVYTRTSIRAAKANAQRHRDADSGGEGIDLLKEHKRRHGMLQRLDRSGGTVGDLVGAVGEEIGVGGGKRNGEEGWRDGNGEGKTEGGGDGDRLRAAKRKG